MNDSIVILGRQPNLGIAELESLYGSESITPIGTTAAQIAVAPCYIDFARLGGTIKLCKSLAVLETTEWLAIQKFLVRVAPAQAEQMPEGKVHLGFSAYDMHASVTQLMAIGLSVKKAIRKHSGRTVRLVPNKNAELNTAQVIHHKLLGSNGWEIVLIRDATRTIIAQTVSIQDIADYTIRDRSRPKRDARVGMLPPKLAQIIINLAIGPQEHAMPAPSLSGNICLRPKNNQLIRDTTILDPFCGTGVILQEALLMGYKAYGTDMEPRMIAYTHTNLDWLTATYGLNDADYRLDVGDATNRTWQEPISTIASETYLGRPFTTLPHAEILGQTVSECNLIIKKFLQHIHAQLRSNTRLCLAVPAWQIRPGEFRQLPLIDHLSEMGYNQVSFQHVRSKDLLYYRADQNVARQLLIITRK